MNSNDNFDRSLDEMQQEYIVELEDLLTKRNEEIKLLKSVLEEIITSPLGKCKSIARKALRTEKKTHNEQ